MGILNSTMGSFDITGQQVEKLHRIVALDTEKTLQATDTSLPYGLTAARMPDNIHIVLHSDQILDSGFTGTQVQDENFIVNT